MQNLHSAPSNFVISTRLRISQKLDHCMCCVLTHKLLETGLVMNCCISFQINVYMGQRNETFVASRERASGR